jgi:hypothetical protein
MSKVTDARIKHELDLISSDVLNGLNYKRNEYARSILNYPAMMVPSVQEPIIKCLSETFTGEINLLDPFMGASNTLVTGMKYGINIFGQDINPLSLLISQVKTTYYTIEDLKRAEESLKNKIECDFSTVIEVNFNNIDKWFEEKVQIELSKLYRAIICESSLSIRKFCWVTLAEVIRLTSNDRTSTFKLHRRSIEEIQNRNISPIDVFFSILKRSIQDVNDYCSVLSENKLIENGQYKKQAQVVWGDTSKEINFDESFDLLVTSPPYGDNQTTVTYGQFSFLPLQWIPIADIDRSINFDYLKTTQEIDAKSLGGRSSHSYKEAEEKLFDSSETLKQLFDDFNEAERKRAKKVVNFFYDLDQSIDNIQLKLRNGSYMVWTIGNRSVNKRTVRNDLILTELLKLKDAELLTDLDRDILSKRMPGRNNFSDTMSKEKILIFKTQTSK